MPMTNDPIKFKGNIQKSLPYKYEAKRLYKLENEDFVKMIKIWLNNR